MHVSVFSSAFALPVFSDTQRQALYEAAGLKNAGNAVLDECDKPVTPTINTIVLGGEVGDAVTVQTQDAGCYGVTGARIVILKAKGNDYKAIFSNLAVKVDVLKTTHKGVADIRLGVPGMKIPVWKWDGKKYVYWKSVKSQ